MSTISTENYGAIVEIQFNEIEMYELLDSIEHASDYEREFGNWHRWEAKDDLYRKVRMEYEEMCEKLDNKKEADQA